MEIIQHNVIPPIEFSHLVRDQMPSELYRTVDKLVEKKLVTSELGLMDKVRQMN